ncbi:MAG TPA: hypothetical protein VGD45_20300 [Steroidobacter sp.]|uniref:hypothetical protein n=1 Tax=Steroidobacter sp. TaxID=1978227 RepID=UPI002ED77476
MLTIVSIACNNHRNGHFAGRFDAVTYGHDMEIRHEDERGMSIGYAGSGRLRISRRIFRYQREQEWSGNWCWNAFWMRPTEARQLLRYLKASGRWHCEAGPSRLFHWFNGTAHREMSPQIESRYPNDVVNEHLPEEF